MKFRPKPCVVDAIRFVRAEVAARLKGDGFDLHTGVSFDHGAFKHLAILPTMLTRRGRQPVMDGDWIVTYPDGQAEVINPDIFAATFEHVAVDVPPAGQPPPRARRRRSSAKKPRGRR